MDLRIRRHVPICSQGEIEDTEITQRNSSDTAKGTSSASISGVSSEVAASTSTSATASEQEALTTIQAGHISLNPDTEITQRNSSDTANGTSSASISGVSSEVAASTSTSAAASNQEALTTIQAGHISLSPVKQPVSHAEQQVQQLLKQQLQQKQQQQQQLELSPEKTTERKELEQFAKTFKQRRKKLGLSQGDVALAMGRLYGYELSQSTISYFEGLKLSSKIMRKTKTLLQNWLEDSESSLTNPGSLKNPMTTRTPEAFGRRKKIRTFIETDVRGALEKAFLQNPYPTPEEKAKLAESLAMEKNVVHVWFNNRRQKEKMITPPSAAMGSPPITGSAPSNMFISNANSLAAESLPSSLSPAPETGGHSFRSGKKRE